MNSKNKTLLQVLIHAVSANFGTKLISVVIAVVLWGVVLGSRNVEVTKEIPIEIVTSPDVTASNDIPDRISFRLSGPKAFLRTILDRREDPIRINLTGSKPSLLTYRFFSDSIRVPIGVKVMSISPAAIQIRLEYLKHKEVPVRVELRGRPAEGYRVGSVHLHPESVKIKGPESRIDPIVEVATTPIDISEMKKPLDKEVSLDLLRSGLQLDSPPPHAVVDIEPVSANFRIKNVDIRIISTYKVRIEDKSVTVLVRAAQRDLETLDRTQIFATVDVRNRAKGKYSEAVKVTLPSSIGLVRVVPDHVTFTLY